MSYSEPFDPVAEARAEGIEDDEEHRIVTDDPDVRRTPIIRPLGMSDAEAWDFEMGREL